MTRAKSDNLRVLMLHMTGNANMRQALLALDEAGMLAALHTTIAWQPGSFLDRLLPAGLRSEFARRSFPGISAELIHTHPWQELMRLIAVRMGWHSLIRRETGRFRTAAIAAALDRAVARTLVRGPLLDAILGVDSCALETFRAARMRGIRCIYEMPIGYLRAWSTLCDDEIALEPLWGKSLSSAADSEAALAQKDEEIAAADVVIAPSLFVARTLEASPARKIVIVPYGCPSRTPAASEAAELRERRRNGPLRVLYVGLMSQRKGISYLLRAMELLGSSAELSLVGRLLHPNKEMAKELSRHRWTPTMVPAQVLEAMRNSDVLVLPTLFEGRALVVLEALSQGLPVITTPNSGTEDLVIDGVTGYIVPIRSTSGLVAALTRMIEDRSLLTAMSKAAFRAAAECTWDAYRQQFLSAVSAGITDRANAENSHE